MNRANHEFNKPKKTKSFYLSQLRVAFSKAAFTFGRNMLCYLLYVHPLGYFSTNQGQMKSFLAFLQARRRSTGRVICGDVVKSKFSRTARQNHE